MSPRKQDLTEGEPAVDKYYFCDGLQSDGFFQEQSQETWSKMMKLWLVDTQGDHCKFRLQLIVVLQTHTRSDLARHEENKSRTSCSTVWVG